MGVVAITFFCTQSVVPGVLLLPPAFIFLTRALSTEVQLHSRTGVWSSMPRTREEIILQVGSPQAPIAISEGWSFQLGFKSASNSAIALRGNWSGVVKLNDESSVRVRSGTLFGELTRDLFAQGLTLLDRPQFDQLS